MRQFMIFGAALSLACLIGCNQSEVGGKKSDNTRSSETFRVSAPVTSTTVKQGDRQTVKLSVDRGTNFKENVTLKTTNPDGLTVTFEPSTLKASDGETVTATVEAAKDAAVGDRTVKVTATPEKGNSTEVEFTVKVEKKTD